MRIVFWTNCLSPHLLPFIVHLTDDERVDEVVVCAAEDVSAERKDMGWSIGKYEGLDRCIFYINPNPSVIDSLMKKRTADSWHVFSGIRAYTFVFECLKHSIQYKLKRGMISERPNTYDFKHNVPKAKPYWLHRIRFLLQDSQYAKHMDFVFAMGQEAVRYFRSVGMKWEVFPFCYCTEFIKYHERLIQDNNSPQFLYCGSLSTRKSPKTILEGVVEIGNSFSGRVSFIGDGVLKPELEEYVAENNLGNIVTLLGTKEQSEIPKYMQQADVLILPSLYDGWGAVINEALQTGCYIICSDACGASDLLLGNQRLGKVFHYGDVKELVIAMKWCNEHIKEIRADKTFRVKWAENHISGKVVAKYFVDCLLGSTPASLW